MASLNEIAPRAFDEAVKTGDIVFTASEVQYVREGPLEFEIRTAPGLSKKPQQGIDDRTPRDPFSPPYPAKLLLREYERHVLLFNKFAVCREHLLVVTKEFRKQTEPVTPEDFGAAWEVMDERKERNYIAFYNCGDDSGASQPHKHIQLVPGNAEGREFYPPVMRLIAGVNEKPGTIFRIPEYRFIHGFVLLDESRLSCAADAGAYLSDAYGALLGHMFDALHSYRAKLLRSSGDPSAFPTFVSYNLVFTRRFMLLVPRSCKATEHVSLNSVGYAGMVLLKEAAQKERIESFGDALRQLAFPLEDGAEIDKATCGGGA